MYSVSDRPIISMSIIQSHTIYKTLFGSCCQLRF